jgi:ABC-2 type transport system ATP-binding protein
MKRRLDLALALVHEPRVLFLDEPTTGLDPQSRTALWEEVARLASEEGATVFLTTQYLEEADALARRVGIIDRGKIVALGTTAELKRSVGAATVEAIVANEDQNERAKDVLASFGDHERGHRGGVAVRMREQGHVNLAGIVRALDEAQVDITQLLVHEPSLDDVFFAKTGRSLEGDGEASVEPSL